MVADGYCHCRLRAGSITRSRLLPRSAMSRWPWKGEPAPAPPTAPPYQLGRREITLANVPEAIPAWSVPDCCATSPPTR